MTLTQIEQRQDAIRARLLEIKETAAPGEDADEAARSAFDALGGETDALLTEWDELEAKRVPLAERAEKLQKVETAVRGGRIEAGSTGPDLVVRNNRSPFENMDAIRGGVIPGEDLIGRARTAIEQAPRHMSDDAREQVTRMLDEYAEDNSAQAPLISRHLLMTGSPDYHAEFKEYCRTGYAGESLRAAMSLTDANGGYLVPFTLDPTVILTNAGIKGNIRSISKTVTIATDNWNGVSSAGVTAEWTAEATEWADASPTFAQPSITPKKADAWIQASYEVLADSGFSSELGRLLADAKVRLEEAAFATGNTGATKPRGIVAAVAAVTASLVTSATTGAFVVGDVYNTAGALPARYEDSATWLCHKLIANKIRQFDTAGGSSFWANLGMKQPPQLMDSPLYRNSTMASTVGNANLILLVGDFQYFQIVDRVGMTVLYEPMVKGSNRRPTGEAGYAAYWRVGSDTTNVDAFRCLQLNQTAAAVALA